MSEKKTTMLRVILLCGLFALGVNQSGGCDFEPG